MNPRTQLIVDELARHRTQFEHFCRDLSPGELAVPIPDSHWTVKHYIAHLCTIDALIANSSAPMSTIRPSNACFCSSFVCHRAIA